MRSVRSPSAPWAVLVGLLSGPGVAGDVWLEPARPTETDAIALHVNGTKPSACWDVVGNLVLWDQAELSVRVLLRRRTLACAQDAVPYQTYVSIGQLPPGEYRITVADQAVDQNPSPAWAELVFTVTTNDGEPPPAGDAFIRGDATQDRTVDISDAIALLGVLFLGTQPSTCSDAEDANDDGEIDLSDALSILGWVFLSTTRIPAPHPDCGLDPTPDGQPACDYGAGEC